MWFAGWLITVVFVWEDPWVCLWEQNPDFNYIPSGYSDYVFPKDLVSLAFTYPMMCTGFNRRKKNAWTMFTQRIRTLELEGI